MIDFYEKIKKKDVINGEGTAKYYTVNIYVYTYNL